MRGGLTGLVLGAIILVVIGIVPMFMRAQATAQRAQRQAEAARRALSDYDLQLGLATARLDADALRSRDAAAASRLDQAAAANRARLDTASQAASSASQTDREASGVADIVALVSLTRATESLGQARLISAQLRSAEAGALAAARELVRRQAELASYTGVETRPVLDTLAADRADLEGQLAQAREELAATAAEIERREAELAQLNEQMKQLRSTLLSIESTGFRLGDESAFKSYAQQYTSTSQQLAALQQREQLLAQGGLVGATLDADDLYGSAIEGGEAQPGLDEWRYRHGQAEQRVRLLEAGIESIEAAAANARAIGESAASQADAYRGQVEAAKSALNERVKQMGELAEAARAREEEALSAAEQALSAFQTAKSSAEAFQRKAQSVQRDYDPQRLNPRLRTIIDDGMLAQQAVTAGASAQTVLGKVHLERAGRLARQLEAFKLIVAAGVPLETQDLETALNDSRTKATEAFTAARDTYMPLADGSGPTAWVHKGALAVTHYWMSAVNPGLGEPHRVAARTTLDQALQGIDRSPYAQHLVRLRAQLTPAAPTAPPAATTNPG